MADYQIAGFPRIVTLTDYFTWLVELLECLAKTARGREIYNRICEFYFVLDQAPLARVAKPAVARSARRPTDPLSAWMVDLPAPGGSFWIRQTRSPPNRLRKVLRSAGLQHG